MFLTKPITVTLILAICKSGMTSATDSELDYNKVYDMGVDKRAYTYSANKRPQYDFGIGKRSPDRQRMYSFGLGKRFSNDDNLNYEDLIEDELLRDEYNKRIKPYEFGLGKRAAPAPYSFGLGKRGGSGQNKLYSFGLGKRGEYNGISQRSQRYNFGIGKRDVSEDLNDLLSTLDEKNHNIYTRASQRYNFGVGKRSLANEFGLSPRSQRYNFGIGKRDVSEDLDDFLGSLDNDKEHNIYTRASQKYNFGLGKRYTPYDNDEDDVNSIYEHHQPNADSIKRSRYDFGLGKRSAEDFTDVMQLVDGINRDTRAKQRYNFGLGKREVSKEDLQQLEEDVSPTSTSLSSADLRSVLDDNNLSHQHASNTRKREIAIENNNNNKHQMPLKH